jgi:hypothetical protein
VVIEYVNFVVYSTVFHIWITNLLITYGHNNENPFWIGHDRYTFVIIVLLIYVCTKIKLNRSIVKRLFNIQLEEDENHPKEHK